MSPFTSPRERRLWLWTLAVVAAIYSTLGLAGTLAGVLLDNRILGNLFVFCFFLVIAAGAAQWLKTRPGRAELWVGLGVGAAYLLAGLRLGVSPAERTHLIEYGVVAMLLYQALLERAGNGRRVPYPALIAVAATALLGWLDEGLQAALPNRVYDLIDVGFNALAGLMAVTASWALRRVRDRRAGDGGEIGKQVDKETGRQGRRR